MKTLDEVIQAVDYCRFSSDCNPCPYRESKSCAREKMTDALHYLKEYSSKQDTIAEQLAELEQKNDHVCELAKTVCEEYDRLCNRLAEEYCNDPLTWDELKSMEGKPVWVEHRLFKGWRLIGWQANDHMMNLVGPYSELPLFADGCGSDWQAYRKERE